MAERHLSVGSRDDAELIALGKQLEPLHATYWGAIDQFEARQSDDLDALDVAFERAGEEMQPILRAISALQAHTEAGRRVKLLAVAHCLDCDSEGFGVLPEGAVQCALDASVARDFLRAYGITLRSRPRAKHQASDFH